MSFFLIVIWFAGIIICTGLLWLAFSSMSRHAATKRRAEVEWEVDRLITDGWRTATVVEWPFRGEMEVCLLSPLGIAIVILIRRWRRREGDAQLVKTQAAYISGLGAASKGCASVIVLTSKHARRETQFEGTWIVSTSELRELVLRLEKECVIEGQGPSRLIAKQLGAGQ